jgi:nucleoside-diphosphate-sugar epimerase
MPGESRLIAVTGATGFIGHHVCRELIRNGYKVIGLGRDTSRLPAGVRGRDIRDLTDASALRSAFRGSRAVIHLAGRAHVMHERGDAEALYRKVNVDGTLAVAQAAAAEGVAQVIFTSSVKAIGEVAGRMLDDSTEPQPVDAYGRSKLEAERTLQRVGAEAGFEATIVRLPLVYGPGVKGNVLRLFDAVWRGIPLPIGGIRNERSLLGIDNLVGFTLQILEEPVRSSTPFLLSDPEAASTESLVRMIGSALGRKPRIVNVPIGVLHAMGRAGDLGTSWGIRVVTSADIRRLTRSLRIDSSRAWAAAGITPVVPLDEGMRRVAQWYISNH